MIASTQRFNRFFNLDERKKELMAILTESHNVPYIQFFPEQENWESQKNALTTLNLGKQ